MSDTTAVLSDREVNLICQKLRDDDPIFSPSLSTRMGRQPIFGRENQLLGYELLYRDFTSKNSAAVVDGDLATASVLSNALLEMGLERVIGDSRAFVNFTKSYLTGVKEIPSGQDRVVIEVLENVDIDESVVEGLQRLSERGYLIALDDFQYSTEWEACLEIADIVKVDVLALSGEEVSEQVRLLKKYGVKLLAEKVEDHETHQMCMELGFEMFQGYYYAKPKLIEGHKTQASHTALLRTLGAVNDEEAEVEDIADAVSQDAMLTHKLIRYVNSSAFGRRYEVESPSQVIVYLGKQEVRSIVTLLLLTSIEDKPSLLMKTALVRAKACQNLAEALGIENNGSYFTAGLLSMLDALLDRPLSSIMKELPLKEELKSAIINHEGPMGACLKIVTAYERLEACSIDFEPLQVAKCFKAYADALASVMAGEGMAGMLPREVSSATLDKLCEKNNCVA